MARPQAWAKYAFSENLGRYRIHTMQHDAGTPAFRPAFLPHVAY